LARATEDVFPSNSQEAREKLPKELRRRFPMLKRVGIFVMALASLGAILPATALAAERGREDKQVVVQRFDRGRTQVVERRVVVKHARKRHNSRRHEVRPAAKFERY
jgi:ribose 1,5-bisphosphokinase PhnN